MLCSLDGAAALPCTSPKTYTNLVAGSHQFSVEVIDPQRLVDPLPIVYSWTIVDVTAPQTSSKKARTNPSESSVADVRLLVQRGQHDVPVRPRHNGVHGLPRPGGARRPQPRLPPAARARRRLRRAVRPLAGHMGLDGRRRRDCAGHQHRQRSADDERRHRRHLHLLRNRRRHPGHSSSGSSAASTPASGSRVTLRTTSRTWRQARTRCACAPSTCDLNIDADTGQLHVVRARPAQHADGHERDRRGLPGRPGHRRRPGGMRRGDVPDRHRGWLDDDGRADRRARRCPAGFSTSGALYFDLRTTASFLGQPMVCFEFDPAAFSTPLSVRLLHHTSGSLDRRQLVRRPRRWRGLRRGQLLLDRSPSRCPPNRSPIAPPTRSITVGPPALTVNFTHVIEFTGTDDWTLPVDLEFECLLDGELLGSCSAPYEFEALSAGEHLLEVRAIDEAGQVDPTPAQRRFTIVDLTAPDTSIAVGPDSPTTDRIATFEFVAEIEPPDPPGATFECALDEGDFAPCATPFTVNVPEPAAGAHVLLVRAVDLEGNADPTPDIYEWLIEGPPDTTAPETIFVAGPPAVTPSFDAVVTFTSNEAGVEFRCSIDGGPFECVRSSRRADRPRARSALRAGASRRPGRQRRPDPGRALVDDRRPARTRRSRRRRPIPARGRRRCSPSPRTWRGRASSVISTVRAGPTCTSPHLVSFTDPEAVEGPHTFTVRAINADNPLSFDTTPATYAWQVGLAPDTDITSVETLIPEAADPALTLRLGFTGSDDLTNPIDLEFECRVDQAAFETCSTSRRVRPDDAHARRPHVRRARRRPRRPAPTRHRPATPSPSSRPRTRSVLQRSRPRRRRCHGPTSATFTFDSDVVGGDVRVPPRLATRPGSPRAPRASRTPGWPSASTCSRCGPRWPAATSTSLRPSTPGSSATTRHRRPRSSPGRHRHRPRRTTRPSRSRSRVPPTAARRSRSSAPSLDRSRRRCRVCDAVTGWTNPTPLTPGAYTFEVIASTPHLLVDAEPQTWEFVVVDETDPETTIVDGPNLGPATDLASGPLAAFVFGADEAGATFECALDGAPFAACSTPQEYSSLAPGERTLAVRAVDTAGNVDETPATRTWTVFGAPGDDDRPPPRRRRRPRRRPPSSSRPTRRP